MVSLRKCSNGPDRSGLGYSKCSRESLGGQDKVRRARCASFNVGLCFSGLWNHESGVTGLWLGIAHNDRLLGWRGHPLGLVCTLRVTEQTATATSEHPCEPNSWWVIFGAVLPRGGTFWDVPLYDVLLPGSPWVLSDQGGPLFLAVLARNHCQCRDCKPTPPSGRTTSARDDRPLDGLWGSALPLSNYEYVLVLLVGIPGDAVDESGAWHGLRDSFINVAL